MMMSHVVAIHFHMLEKVTMQRVREEISMEVYKMGLS